jgi:hypothetical protein
MVVVISGGKASARNQYVAIRGGRSEMSLTPTPKSDKESPPAEKEDASIDVDDIQDRDRPRFMVDRVDLGGLPQKRYLDHDDVKT